MKRTTTNNKYLKDIANLLDSHSIALKDKYAKCDYPDEDEDELWSAIETLYKLRKLTEQA